MIEEDNKNKGKSEEDTHIAIFNGKTIRRTWFAERWWFVIEDVISTLTDSNDVKQYIKKMRKRDEILDKAWVQIVPTLPIMTEGGNNL